VSQSTETSKTGEAAKTAPAEGRARRLDLIACDGCGRRFATDDGAGMIAAIKGPCPDCGGRFLMVVDD
jgi:DNA-directed RNA polymerase subunit RPC12/RpoP